MLELLLFGLEFLGEAFDLLLLPGIFFDLLLIGFVGKEHTVLVSGSLKLRLQ